METAHRRTNGQFAPSPRRRKNSKDEWERLCSGPAHVIPAWLPETDKYFYKLRRGGVNSRCRLCHLWGRTKTEPGVHGYVPIHIALPFFVEGVNRVGNNEFARRVGLSRNGLYNILNRKQDFVTKRTLRNCMLELVSIRRREEVRHKDSISRGSNLRGEPEKIVRRQKDLYKRHGDDSTEFKRKSRLNHKPRTDTDLTNRPDCDMIGAPHTY